MSSITSEEAKEATIPLKKPDHLPAVPDHRVNYKRRTAPPAPGRKNDCCKRFLIFLSTVFCMSTLALVGILLWREFSHEECDTNSTPVHELFRGYFRTQEEQKLYEQAVHSAPRFQRVNYSITTGQDCQFKCSSYNTPVNKSNMEVHVETDDVCCLSEVRYTALSNLSNIYGTERTIAQFKDRFQFFRVETCKQNMGCTGCQCVQNYITVTAVFLKESNNSLDAEYSLDWFSIPANCYCKLRS